MKCVYVYKNQKTFNSEEQLDDFILNNGILLTSKYGDLALLVSYTLNIIDSIKTETRKLLELFKEAKSNANYDEEGQVLDFKPPYIGVSKFLKGLKNSKDRLLAPEFKDINYWLKRLEAWLDLGLNTDELEILGTTPTESVSKEELEKFLEKDDNFTSDNTTLNCIGKIREHWYNQGKLGTEIHSVLQLLFSTVQKDGPAKGKLMLTFDNDYLVSLFNNISLSRENIIEIIEYARNLKSNIENILHDTNLLFYPELQVSGELSHEVEDKGNRVLGIIDLLVIDSSGKAHIIDYKCSPKNSFNSAKELTFLYQLGLYYRMLSLHGISFSEENTTMIAPILMEGFKLDVNGFTINHIKARNELFLLEDITNKTLYGVVRANLDEFIPIASLVNLPPEEISEKLKKFNDTLFPIVSSHNAVDDVYIKKYIERKGGILYDKNTNKYYIKDRESYTGNTELEVIEKVTKYFKETLPNKQEDFVQQTRKAFKLAIKLQTTDIELPKIENLASNIGASASWLRDFISKYANSEYRILEHEIFSAYGIIVLENITTKQLDFVKVTIEDIADLLDLQGNKLLTGNVINDRDLSKKLDDKTMLATIGNIHTMQVMAIINCIPELAKKTIGNIHVINPLNLLGNPTPSGEELKYNFKLLISYVEDFVDITDTFTFADPIELMRNKLATILQLEGGNKYKKFHQFENLLGDLDSAISKNDELKSISLILQFIKELESKFSGLLELTLDYYSEEANPARALYESAMLALASLKGISFKQLVKRNTNSFEFINEGVQSLMMDNPGNLDNDTLNKLVTLVTLAYQNVREDMQRHMLDVRLLVSNLKKDKGFTKLKEMTVGNAASLYSNMIYIKDGDLLFKNPWKDPTIETEAEREFLKYALTIINQNRLQGDAEALKNLDDPRYFRVPLTKGGTGENLSNALKNKLKKIDPRNWVEVAQLKFLKIFESKAPTYDDRKLFEMINMFNESDAETRISKIRERGIDYFEKNIETLLLKHIFAYSLLKHINDVMPMAKASMIHLIVQGNLSNLKFTEATDYIKKYIRNKIKNEDINETYPELWKSIGKLRNAASFLILAFNPVLYPGQLLQGLLQDIRIIVLNLGREDNPFTAKNLTKAWGILHKDMFTLGNKVTKCSLLNEFFGLNDMDMNTYAEKIKSDKYGIFNFTNIAFHCASRPDFFNRMSLFIAQMMHDGTWEAYEVNSNGLLVYNFKKDPRFDAYANNDKSDINKYNKLKALYEVMARQLVDEGALKTDGTHFRLGDSLPKAYTNKQIESTKSFIDNIYGYYTHEKKAMVHAYWWGALWMQMRTFWSGKKNQYLGSQGVKLLGKYIHLKNEKGELMYYKEENGKLIPTTDITDLPILKWEGQWLEGIFCSLKYFIHDVKNKGWKFTINELNENPDYALQRANLILLAYDLTMFVMIGPILASLMGDWSDSLEKDARKSSKIDDGIFATAARIAIKSVNYGFLDFNFFDSIGGPILNVQPVSLNYISSRMKDLADCITGDRSFSNSLLRISSVTSNARPLINTIID